MAAVENESAAVEICEDLWLPIAAIIIRVVGWSYRAQARVDRRFPNSADPINSYRDVPAWKK